MSWRWRKEKLPGWGLGETGFATGRAASRGVVRRRQELGGIEGKVLKSVLLNNLQKTGVHWKGVLLAAVGRAGVQPPKRHGKVVLTVRR